MENDLMSLKMENSQSKCAKGCENLEQITAELAFSKEQLMMAQMKITDLQNKDEEIKKLEQTVRDLTLENETVGVLKAQVSFSLAK